MLRLSQLLGCAGRNPWGVGVGKIVTRWKAWGSSDWQFNNPATNGVPIVRLRYSADGSYWWIADSVSSNGPIDRSISPVGMWPYWSVLVDNAGDTRIAEVEFYDSGGLIAQGVGTQIGNATQNGGLAAAFDGNTSQVQANCAYSNSGFGYVGKHY